MQDWGRLITAMVTPFDESGKLDLGGACSLAGQLAQEGATALVLAGTTGESPTLSKEEKLALFRSVKKAVSLPVIANVGSNNTLESAEFAQAARKTGVDGLMTVVPYYNKPNKAGLYRHYQTIAEAGRLPLMIYNVPGRTGLNLDAGTILQLTEIPYVCCIKEATDDFAKIACILRNAPPHFKVYTGEDSLTLPVLAVGGYGVVSVASHVAGPIMRRMIDSFLSGNIALAQKLHLTLSPLYESLFMTSNPIPVKAALRIRGFNAGPLRLPLIEADDTVIARLSADLAGLARMEGADKG
ncbi:MAG: 4-hydroxy-tetrahydrodipicolinate synthase [Clostridia bacterium]|nr:4-hydroxy-tetrahydrodipicolinate synthase [Clostridia bacterium]